MQKLDMIGVQALPNSDIIRFNALGQADISQYWTASKIQEVDSRPWRQQALWL